MLTNKKNSQKFSIDNYWNIINTLIKLENNKNIKLQNNL